MPYKIGTIILCAVLAGSLYAGVSRAADGVPSGGMQYDLPPLAVPERYGNILIDRLSTKNKVPAVAFSHWLHRKEYTCRVCHSELEFAMKTNTTEITEADNRAGRYCGACHNGRIAFRHSGNCVKCHNGNIGNSEERFSEFDSQPYPRNISGFGNGINWVEAQRVGMIRPATYLKRKSQSKISFNRTFFFPSRGTEVIPPALFPHGAHVAWLDCSNCHPDLFSTKQKSTKELTMDEIAKGNFCGVCHLTVAFPVNDCNGCHPDLKFRTQIK